MKKKITWTRCLLILIYFRELIIPVVGSDKAYKIASIFELL